jgi:hypothetical protein
MPRKYRITFAASAVNDLEEIASGMLNSRFQTWASDFLER